MASNTETAVIGALALIFLALVGVLVWLLVAKPADDDDDEPDAVANARALLSGCHSASDVQRNELINALDAYSDAPGAGTLTALRTAMNAFECTTQTPALTSAPTQPVSTFDAVSIEGVSGRKRPPQIYVLFGMGVLGALVAAIVYYGKKAATSETVRNATMAAVAGAAGAVRNVTEVGLGAMDTAAAAVARAPGTIRDHWKTFWKERRSLDEIRKSYDKALAELRHVERKVPESGKNLSIKEKDTKKAQEKVDELRLVYLNLHARITKDQINTVASIIPDVPKGYQQTKAREMPKAFNDRLPSKTVAAADQVTKDVDKWAVTVLKELEKNIGDVKTRKGVKELREQLETKVKAAKAAEAAAAAAEAAAAAAAEAEAAAAAEAEAAAAAEAEAAAAAQQALPTTATDKVMQLNDLVSPGDVKIYMNQPGKPPSRGKESEDITKLDPPVQARDAAGSVEPTPPAEAKETNLNKAQNKFRTEFQQRIKVADAGAQPIPNLMSALPPTMPHSQTVPGGAGEQVKPTPKATAAGVVPFEPIKGFADPFNDASAPQKATAAANAAQNKREREKRHAVTTKVEELLHSGTTKTNDEVRDIINEIKVLCAQTNCKWIEGYIKTLLRKEPEDQKQRILETLLSRMNALTTNPAANPAANPAVPAANPPRSKPATTTGNHYNAIVYTDQYMQKYKTWLQDRTAQQEYEALFPIVNGTNKQADFSEKSDIYREEEVEADGNCFYHAVKYAMGQTFEQTIPDATNLRTELANMDEVSEQALQRLTGDPTLNENWAQDEEIELFAKKYGVMVCIWLPGNRWEYRYDGFNQELKRDANQLIKTQEELRKGLHSDKRKYIMIRWV
jgi:hypothetical protein